MGASDHPLGILARLLGGVALMRGRLGHQVLGQLLVMGTSDVAIAGATVVVTAASRQRNAVAQVELRTAAPAIAVSVITQRQEARVQRREENVAARERAVQETTAATTLAMEALQLENRALRIE